MKTILLPTDFSDNSWNAITYALQLFKNEPCTFYLLNTYTPIIYQVEYLLGDPAQYEIPDVIRETSLNKLNDFKDKIKTEFNNPKHIIETLSVFNTLIAEIKEIVSEKNIDYVIMGTKGATGAKEVLFGSNTVHVFKSVKCPVLAIPENFTFEPPHELLFPTDLELDFTAQHLQPIRDITSMYVSRINVLHVSYGYDLTEEQIKNKKKLERHFKGTAYLFHSVANESVQQAISEFQMHARINLLVMINNKHSFFENLFFKSTVNQIGFHLNIPFLLIPAKQ